MRKGNAFPRRLLPAALVAVALSGCSSVREAQRVDHVLVRWLGHNSFAIRSSLGLVLVTDPFDPAVLPGPRPVRLHADVALISHESPAATNLDLIENIPQTFRSSSGVGVNRAFGIPLLGVATYPDPAKPDLGRANTVFVWKMDGLRFCHLGWIPGTLREEQVTEIGMVDVLFLPVGGPASLDDRARAAIVESLRPRVIVPMGYRTARTPAGANLAPLEPWLASARVRVIRLPKPEFVISRGRLPVEPIALVPRSP